MRGDPQGDAAKLDTGLAQCVHQAMMVSTLADVDYDCPRAMTRKSLGSGPGSKFLRRTRVTVAVKKKPRVKSEASFLKLRVKAACSVIADAVVIATPPIGAPSREGPFTQPPAIVVGIVVG